MKKALLALAFTFVAYLAQAQGVDPVPPASVPISSESATWLLAALGLAYGAKEISGKLSSKK